MDIKIQPKLVPATDSDLDAICEIYKQELPYLKWTYNKRYMRSVLHDKTSTMLCLKLDELIIGCVQCYYEKDHVLINTIAICKGFQGLGYGERIFRHIEKMLIPGMYLWFWMTDSACEFRFWTKKDQPKSHIDYYKRLGYKIYDNESKWTGFKKEIK